MQVFQNESYTSMVVVVMFSASNLQCCDLIVLVISVLTQVFDTIKRKLLSVVIHL